MSDREFDLVLFGATGFTGRLVAEYLRDRAKEAGVRWAVAGRDPGKLSGVLEAIGAEVAVLIGDAMDEGAMLRLAERTRVIVTTVGPYAKYGGALVAACAKAGTDYCDLTGEVQFMRAMIDAHHERAKESGARIVHTCGYDSIPSDLGVLALFEHARDKGIELHRITHYAGEARGGFSGGTVASMLTMLEQAGRDRALRRLLASPYALNPEPRPSGPDTFDAMDVRFSDELQMWTGPFVMGAVNTRVVRRSNALLGQKYGADFRYEERMSTGRGVKGFAAATGLAAALGGGMVALSVDRVRAVVAERWLPKPGEGPSREDIEKGFFVSRFIGQGRKGERVKLTIRGQRDPGYGATARMLSESALCLLQDELPREGGVRTPASTMGLKLLPRLDSVGIRFEYE